MGLAAGTASTCALNPAGEVACWGRIVADATPQVIDGIEGAAQVALSWSDGCARTGSGLVQCWDDEHPPVTVGGLKDVIELLSDSCARSADGTIRCWSFPDPTVEPRELRRRAREQARRDREDGITRGSLADALPPMVPGERTPRDRGRALRELLQEATSTANDGVREVWLIDADGRLRSLSTADGITSEDIGPERRARMVRMRGRNLCWITADGGIRCRARPADKVPALDLPNVDAVDLAVDREHACAVTASGRVACWGENFSGQLGDGTLESRLDPVEVAGIDDAVAVAVGYGHSCVLRRAGALACWGSGESGELGDPEVSTSPRGFPSRVTDLPPSVELVTSEGETCARSIEGSVTCWGSTRGSKESPRCIPAVGGGFECGPLIGKGSACGRRAGRARTDLYPRTLSNLSKVRDLGAAWGEFCAASSDGVTCWRGHTGCSSTGRDLAANTRHFPLADAAQVTRGHRHLCASTRDGAVYCTGDDSFGQLGGATADAASLQRVPGLAEVVALAAGYDHTCALHRSGEVTCWGFNATGQAGAPPARAVGPTRVSAIRDAVELSSGTFHTCARRSTGRVVCWGENEYGSLGDGTLEDRTTPTAVLGLDHATALTSNDWQTCARTEIGQVSCWGGNRLNPLGLAVSRPVMVVPGWGTCRRRDAQLDP